MNTPVAETLMLTTRCSTGCSHCAFSRPDLPKQDLSRERVRRVLARSSAKLIVISGGEPFEHPEIDEILCDLLKEKRPFRIATGGSIDLSSWITSLKRLAKSETGFQGISLGTDALSNRCQNHLLRSRWRENLQLLQNAGVPYSITITLGEDLSAEFAHDLTKTLQDLDASAQFLYIRFSRALPGGESIAKEWGKVIAVAAKTEFLLDCL